ncbi:diaminopimelate decarboxylase [Frondihabitans sp. VKM Ac-2883]|uniref:diaminopimelate decarboxylase n=1 Tax=Frondihabitans sp. VKM Ac-2883 TaxID=2783823 RepID=UPI00188C9E24|nr:diaminopimelate decarboxylase [Frondihabitans sp. VKM Ac-2883]MBF4576274.1 diaminopimelate decarboxylase [Frondihabitans sp. VKM Ac-2883]
MTTTANPLAPAWLDVPVDANDLVASIWPSSAGRDDDGALTFGGVSATELAARFDTPLYVVDEADFRARAVGAHDAFAAEAARIGTRAKVYYAGKAFLSVEIARWVSDAGLFVDVCTGGELAVALAAGVAPERMGFHGNNKSRAEIDRAVSLGVGAVVIDSLLEIDRVAEAAERHGTVQNVRIRVNSGVHASTHDYLATAREDQKFGIPLADTPAAVAAIRSHAGLRLLGLHSHIGSQIFGTDGFAEAARRLLEVHASLLAGGDLPELNLGGGFGVNYTRVDDAAPITELAAGIADVVAAECARLDIPIPVLAVEPGRVIAGPAGVTLYTVGTIKDVEVSLDGGDTSADGPSSAVRRYVSVDGGMSDNARTALYAADYSVRLASRVSASDPRLVRLAGKHCESGDLVVLADYLPGDVAPDDLVAVPVTGAYCWSLASNYNHVGRPPVVAVRDGVARVIVHGETIDDLLARDTGFDPQHDARPHEAERTA